MRAIKDSRGPQSCFEKPCKIAERTYFSGFLIKKPLFKLFNFAPSLPILTVLQWILSIFTGFDLVKPSGCRSGWPLVLCFAVCLSWKVGLQALYRAVSAAFFRSASPRPHNRPWVAVCVPSCRSWSERSARDPRAAGGVWRVLLSVGRVYDFAWKPRACTSWKASGRGGRDTASAMGVEIPAQSQISIQLF